MWMWSIPFPTWIIPFGIVVSILIGVGYIIGFGMSLGFKIFCP
jgi:hypothetical protein